MSVIIQKYSIWSWVSKLSLVLILSVSAQALAQQTPADTTNKKPLTRQQMYEQLHGKGEQQPAGNQKVKKVKYIPSTAEELMKYDMEVKSVTKPILADSVQKSQWGIRLGVGLAGTTNTKYALFKDKTITSGEDIGLSFGVVYARRLSENVWIQPEILYNEKGAKIFADFEFDVSVTASTIQVPVLLKAMFGKKIKGFINGGPFMSYVMSANVTGKRNSAPYSEKADFATNGGELEFGMVFGGGMSLPMDDGRFQLEFRHDLGTGTNSKSPGLTDKLYKSSITFAYLLATKKK